MTTCTLSTSHSRDGLEDRLKTFVSFFVSYVENTLNKCDSIISGREERNTFESSNTLVNYAPKIGSKVLGSVAGVSGVTGIAGVAGALGEKGGEYVKDVYCSKHISKLRANGMVDSFAQDPIKFRKDLVSAAVDIFQSFEIQFMKIKTDRKDFGPIKAIQLFAADAADRCINYFKGNVYHPNSLISSILSGKSEKEWGLPFLETAGHGVVSDGFEVEKLKDDWKTASLFDKVGVIKMGSVQNSVKYYIKRKVGRHKKYGFRRHLSKEKLNDTINYIPYDYAGDFYVTYQYLLTPENKEEKKRIILESINKEDPKLKSAEEEDFRKFMIDNISKMQNADVHNPQSNSPIQFGINISDEPGIYPQETLVNLHEIFQNEHCKRKKLKGVKPSSTKIVVCGDGGIGKTEFARNYAQKYYKLFYDSVIWINAHTKESMITAFMKLAEELKFNLYSRGKKKDNLTVVGEVYEYFGTRKSLFVFDDTEVDQINEFLPHKFSQELNIPFILITSRNKNWDEMKFYVKKLEGMSSQDAKSLVKKDLGIMDSNLDRDIEKLVEKFQNNPLLLREASRYIKAMGVNDSCIEGFLAECENNPHGFHVSEQFYDNTSLAIVDIYKRKIMSEAKYGELALEILEYIAYLASGNIDFSLILKLKEHEEEDAIKQAIHLLVSRYSILSEQNKQSPLCAFTIFPHIQKTMRFNLILDKTDYLKDDCTKKCKENCDVHSKMEREKLRNILLVFQSDLQREHIHHAMTVWNHATVYGTLMTSFGSLLSKIIDTLNSLSQYAEAVSFGTKAVKSLEQEENVSMIDVLTAKKGIADALFNQGDNKAALHKYEMVYNGMKHTGEDIIVDMETKYLLDERQRKTLNTMSCIVQARIERREFHLALEACNSLIDQTRKWYPDATLSPIREKAIILDNLGQYTEAIENFREVLQYSDKSSEKDFRTHFYLGIALIHEGNYEEALDTFNFISNNLIYKISDENTVNAQIVQKLEVENQKAIVLNKMGNYSASQKLFLYVIKESENLDNNHPLVLNSLHEFAKLLRNKGEYKDSLEQFQKVLQLRMNQFQKVLQLRMNAQDVSRGHDDPDTLRTRHELAVVLSCLGKYHEALKKLTTIYRVRYRILGKNHRSTLKTLHEVAETLKKIGYTDHAKGFLEEILKKKRMVLRKDHPSILTTKQRIAEILFQQKKTKEALALFEEVHRKRVQALGEMHPQTLSSRNCMEEATLKLERLKNVYDTRDVMFDPRSTVSRNFRDSVSSNRVDLQDEFHTSKSDHGTRLKIQDSQCPSTSTTYNNPQNIKMTDSEIIEIYKKKVGVICESYTDTLTVNHCLSKLYLQQGKIEIAEKHSNIVYTCGKNMGREVLSSFP